VIRIDHHMGMRCISFTGRRTTRNRRNLGRAFTLALGSGQISCLRAYSRSQKCWPRSSELGAPHAQPKARPAVAESREWLPKSSLLPVETADH